MSTFYFLEPESYCACFSPFITKLTEFYRFFRQYLGRTEHNTHSNCLIKMFRVSVLFGWYIILALYGACKGADDQTSVPFSFKEYQYKDSPKNVCIR